MPGTIEGRTPSERALRCASDRLSRDGKPRRLVAPACASLLLMDRRLSGGRLANDSGWCDIAPMMTWLGRARWVLLLSLLLASAGVQSAIAATDSDLRLHHPAPLVDADQAPPCHQPPAKSAGHDEPDCCASNFVCFSKCGATIAQSPSPTIEGRLPVVKSVFRPPHWTDFSAKPPTHPPSA
jgi:hypothetical protein